MITLVTMGNPYMSFVYRTYKDKDVPAIVHKDGTARIQTVPYNSPSIIRQKAY